MSAKGRARMFPLLGDICVGGFTVGDLRAMARMCHTGVPVEDVAYIFGISPANVLWCVRRYVRMWVVLDKLEHPTKAQPGGVVRKTSSGRTAQR